MVAERAPRRALTTVNGTNPTKPTKLPARTVTADDLITVIDGVEYRTHEGESVTFRGGRETLHDRMLALKAAMTQVKIGELAKHISSAGEDPASVDEVFDVVMKFGELQAELQSTLDEGNRRLLSRIVSWTFTDPEGEPYPSPPTLDVLLSLEQEEIDWIKAKAGGDKTPDPLASGPTGST